MVADKWWPSRYGEDDRTGAGNELTAEATLSALQIPKQGRILELAQPSSPGMPMMPPRTYQQLILAHENFEPFVQGEGPATFTMLQEHVVTSNHVGCHLDGLGHAGIDGRYYNGVHYSEFYSPLGLTQFGVETIRPWIGRGVCLDVAALLDVPVLPDGFTIGEDHLAEACERQGLDIGPGDAVLIHTGWGRFWTEDPARYGASEPGVGRAAAEWLTSRRISLVGVDNWGCEVHPGERSDRPGWVHQHLLAETGTHILENIRTDELVGSNASEFLFVLGVPKLTGATAAVVAPLAVL